MSEPSVTCPVCHMTSHHPRDVAEGYCGNCHTWTSGPRRIEVPGPGVVAPPPDEGYTQIPLVTVLGHPRAGHAHARTVIMRARALGLTVDHDHDGRTLVRTHLLTLRGPSETQRTFLKAWARYARAQQRGDTAASIRTRRQELRDRLRQLHYELVRQHPEAG